MTTDEEKKHWLEQMEKLRDNTGVFFLEALHSAAVVRADRRDQYGDTYREDELLFLFYQMRNKLKRFRLQLSVDGLEETIKNPEVALDSLKDLICYAAFAIENIKKPGRE